MNKKYFLLFQLILFSFFHLDVTSQIIINEYSASNKSFVADNNGEYEDWVELYNTSSTDVDISGYYLSDDISNITKWQFPAVTIKANGYLLIFASDRDIYSGGYLHTNFKLKQMKEEEIVFSDASGNIVDSVTMNIPVQKNHSRGRKTDGSATWGLFTTPTPSSTNTNSYDTYAEKPTFSQPAGFYTGTISVSLSVSDPDVTIYFTTDGSAPNTSSTLYSSSLSINTTTLIRAIGVSSNPATLPSFTESNTYFIDVSHTLPVISLGSAGYNSLFNSWSVDEIMTSIEYFDNSQVQQFEMEGDMKGHGNDSWAFQQKGIRFYARDQYGYDHEIKYPIFDAKSRDEYEVLIIRNAGSDNYPGADIYGRPACHLRDAFAQTLSQSNNLELDERSYEPCVVYINGQYWGLYEMRERMDADFTKEYYGKGKDEVDMLEYWGGLEVRYGSSAGWSSLYNYMVNNDLSIQSNYDYVKSEMNVNSMIDYFILNTYLVNTDWLNWNSKWWRGNGSPYVGWRYCLWDEDNILNLGENYTGLPTTNYTVDPCAVQDLFSGNPNIPHTDMINALMENEEFYELYINRYADLLNTVFSCDNMLAHLQTLIDEIAPEMPNQVARWGGSVADWETNLDYLKKQIEGRCVIVDSLMVSCYDIEGPYDITVLVDPPLSGNVKVNTNMLDTYPWDGTYFGGINIDLSAYPETDYEFDYWEVKKHAVSPGINDTMVELNLTQNDTIIAHFIKEELYELTFLVDPPLSGEISINSNAISVFPWSETYLKDSALSLAAIAYTNYEFSHWEMDVHTPLPDYLTDSVWISVSDTDTIIAYFNPILIEDSVIMLPEQESTSLYVPNTFSPDGDNLNDEFKPMGITGNITNYTMQIFNRWGVKVFETDDLSRGWNGIGKSNVKNLQDDVYVYKITYTYPETNKQKTIWGSVTLVR